MPCPGIEAGDMGPKMGYNSKNNGFVRFTQVRIPRDQMLMKFVSVDKEGTFSIEGDLRSLYSVMMDIRVQLIQHSGSHLYKAALIALRYSAVRRQFKNTQGSKIETKLLDY
jgi:acyl-CoA oxidase